MDGRNVLDLKKLEEIGFSTYSIGVSSLNSFNCFEE